MGQTYTVYRIVAQGDPGIYIGTTRNLPQRRTDHLAPRNVANRAKRDWLQRLRAEGRPILFDILGTHPDKRSALHHETRLIEQARATPTLHVYNIATNPSDIPRRRTPTGIQRTSDANRRHNAMHWRITTPDGTTHTITNLKAYCHDHHLDPSTMSQVANGKQPHHKGYTCQRLGPSLPERRAAHQHQVPAGL